MDEPIWTSEVSLALRSGRRHDPLSVAGPGNLLVKRESILANSAVTADRETNSKVRNTDAGDRLQTQVDPCPECDLDLGIDLDYTDHEYRHGRRLTRRSVFEIRNSEGRASAAGRAPSLLSKVTVLPLLYVSIFAPEGPLIAQAELPLRTLSKHRRLIRPKPVLSRHLRPVAVLARHTRRPAGVRALPRLRARLQHRASVLPPVRLCSQPTSPYIHSRSYVTVFAHKECTANGTWWLHPDTGKPWSNYTTCVNPQQDVSDIIAVYEAGYAVSLVALLASLAVLAYFRSLRCARITVHMNLFTSFGANNVLWLAWYGSVVRQPTVLEASPIWCYILNATLHYAMLTNYTWMLCEGLYLHTVLVSAFVSERRLLRALLALGWALPAPAIAVYTWRRVHDTPAACWLDQGDPPTELAVVAVAAVVLNLAFLCNIVRVLCTKLRAARGPGAARPSATALHALRATCLLAPLLGLQYLLMPFRPPREQSWWLAYEYLTALTTSLQGLCVAVLYCFCNGEVLAQVRRRWRALTFRPRANSTTATTVSFVRSTAPLPGQDEDKV